MFEGAATALITPFKKDGSIDEEGLRRLVDFQEENGVTTLVPCGSTGESATLSHEEHIRVAERCRFSGGSAGNERRDPVLLLEVHQSSETFLV